MIKFFFIVLIIFFNHSLYSDTIENWSLIKNLKLSVFDNGYTNPVSMQFVKNSKISKTTSYYVLDQSGKIFLSYNKEKNLFADIKENIGNFEFTDFKAIDLCIDQETTSLFATFTYKELKTEKLVNGLIKFENSKNEILKKPSSITLFNNKILNVNSQENTLIGPCLIDDDNLYLAINNTANIFFKDNSNNESGLVVRINKNTFLPQEDNPFYLKNTISNKNYVFAYGFKNISSFLKLRNNIFFTQNGISVDSFGILEKGKNYLWNGDDKSISATSEFLFSKYQGFSNMTFVDNLSNFPDNFKNKILIISKGKLDDFDNKNGKNIWLFDYDYINKENLSIPKEIARLTGDKNQIPIEIEYYNNSIYFFSFNNNNENIKSNIYKLDYQKNYLHTNLIDEIINPISLINKYNCTSCHVIQRFGKLGAGHAPKLTLDYFTEKFNYINTDEYANFLHGINKNNNDNISEVIKANNYDKIHKWLSYYLVNPQIYNQKNQMANLNISKKEANVLAEYLIGSEDEFNYKIQSSLTKKIKKFIDIYIPKNIPDKEMSITNFVVIFGLLFMYFIYLIGNKLYINRY